MHEASLRFAGDGSIVHQYHIPSEQPLWLHPRLSELPPAQTAAAQWLPADVSFAAPQHSVTLSCALNMHLLK